MNCKVSKKTKRKESKGKKVAQVFPKYGTCKVIQERLGVSKPTVTNALSGTTNSKQADFIRNLAIELGGYPIYK